MPITEEQECWLFVEVVNGFAGLLWEEPQAMAAESASDVAAAHRAAGFLDLVAPTEDGRLMIEAVFQEAAIAAARGDPPG